MQNIQQIIKSKVSNNIKQNSWVIVRENVNIIREKIMNITKNPDGVIIWITICDNIKYGKYTR